MATFTTYSLIHRNDPNPENRFTADKAFVALSLFSIMRFPLSIFPVTISSLIQVTHIQFLINLSTLICIIQSVF